MSVCLLRQLKGHELGCRIHRARGLACLTSIGLSRAMLWDKQVMNDADLDFLVFALALNFIHQRFHIFRVLSTQKQFTGRGKIRETLNHFAVSVCGDMQRRFFLCMNAFFIQEFGIKIQFIR